MAYDINKLIADNNLILTDEEKEFVTKTTRVLLSKQALQAGCLIMVNPVFVQVFGMILLAGIEAATEGN